MPRYQPNQLYWDNNERRVVKLISEQGENWDVQLSAGMSVYTAKQLTACSPIDCKPDQFAVLLGAEIGFLESLARITPSGFESLSQEAQRAELYRLGHPMTDNS